MSDRGRAAAPRWAAVGALVAVLVSLPAVIGALPARRRRVGGRPAGRRPGQRDVGFSGYAESAGGLALPVTDQLTSVADLFSDRTTMRVWWRGADRQPGRRRHRRPARPARTATPARHLDLGVRARDGHPQRPRSPLDAARRRPTCCRSSLGRRLLSEADRRRAVPDRRPAGGRPRRARAPARPGRRRRPRSAGSTSGSTRDSGLPLQVEVFGEGRRPAGARHPVPRPRARRPAGGGDRASTAAGRRTVRRGPAGRGRAARPGGGSGPVAAAGRARRAAAAAARRARRPAIGLYGRGVTLLAVAPVPARLASGLRGALAQQPGRRRRRRSAPGSPPGRSALMLVEPPGRGPLRAHRHGHPRRAGRGGRRSCPSWRPRRERGHQHPRPGQAVRPAARRRRHRPRRAGRRRLRLPRRQRLGQDHDRADAARAWCCPPAARSSCSGERMPRAGRRVLPRVGALIEGPAHYGHLSGRENLSLLDASGPGGSWRTRRARVDEALEQVGLAGVGRRPVKAYSLGMRQRLGPGRRAAAPSGAARARRADQRPGPAGHHRDPRAAARPAPRAGRRSSCPATCWPRSSSCARRVGVLDRGRLVLQDELADADRADRVDRRAHARRPTGCAPPLDGRVTAVDGERVVVRGADPAEVNARLVAAGVPVTGLALERPTLEEVVLAAAGTSTDRVEATGDRRRAAQDVPPSAHLGDDRRPQRAADRWSRCCWCSPTSRRGRARGRRSCPPC